MSLISTIWMLSNDNVTLPCPPCLGFHWKNPGKRETNQWALNGYENHQWFLPSYMKIQYTYIILWFVVKQTKHKSLFPRKLWKETWVLRYQVFERQRLFSGTGWFFSIPKFWKKIVMEPSWKTSWWFQPLWKILVKLIKLDHFPKVRGENKNFWKTITQKTVQDFSGTKTSVFPMDFSSHQLEVSKNTFRPTPWANASRRRNFKAALQGLRFFDPKKIVGT